ncbi:putative Ig domain-containing protein [Bradyrhizobium genosp. P]|uniref:putative Ig domain-containing protein n=1 Tax=Bradyrhizobium genosp. P TaxID=83641 RepID=UPI003CE8B1A5
MSRLMGGESVARDGGFASGANIARIGAWIAGLVLLLSLFSPTQALAFNWNQCVSPTPLAFSSAAATPGLILVGGGLNTDSDGNTCDLYDYGLLPSAGSTADFSSFTVTGTSGATYTFTYLPCNFQTVAPGGCNAGNPSLNTYYTVSVSSTSVTSDSVTVYIDTTPGNTGGNQAIVIPITISQAPATTTTVASSVNPATFPETETFTATVTSTGTVNEGTVAFKSDSSVISGCGAQTVSNGQATCTTALPAGSHSIVAVFSGSANFQTSTSSTLPEVVNAPVTAAQSIASATLTQNVTATSFKPVTGGSGTAPLTYGISPPLPTGLSFDPSTGAVSGTPAVTHATSSFTVTVRDANSQTASNTFSLTVNPAVVATQSIAVMALTQNHAATSFTPVTGSGGTAPLVYSISPTLPSGLSINSSSGAITGTPAVTHAASSFTVTVTDSNGSTASNSFTLTVNPAVTAAQSIPSRTLTQNRAATPFTPVTGGGGTGSLTYSISPSLPAGLSLSPSTGAITGTPTGTSAATSYTVTVTDVNNATASNSFALTVNSAVTATQSIASTMLTQNHAATSFTPVTGAGGSGSLTYGISPSLPAGLSISTSTGAITGTPTGTSAATSYTVTVTDINGATAANSFTLTVNPAVTATQSIASTMLTQNHAATPFTPVTGGGGTGSLTYSISPSLPPGLNLNSATGAISGTPSASVSTTSYTVTVTDTDSATASAGFSLTVNGALSATTAIASTSLTQNKAATSFTPVTGGGGTAPLTYLVSPSLPSGLSFSPSTGAVTGTPSAVSAATSYTVTVTDANGTTATANFSLTVNSAVTATQAIASTMLTQNRAATSFTPVTGGGGTGSLTYSVSPILPAGLSLNTSTGAVTGTPTATSAATSFTVTVTDANGATATASFSLTVNGGVTATQAIASTTLTQNKAATSFTPVTGAGGTAPLTYSVSPALPAGVSFSSSTGAITGTPTATSAARAYTVTVTDAHGATATNTFSLAVNGAVTATQAVASTTLTENRPATSFTPVTGGGGTAPLSYSVSPILPAGLSLNMSTGAVTGTPTVTSATTSYTVTVTDANGATATATFGLIISGPVTAITAVASTLLPVNQAASFVPVTGSGGTAPLSYAVSPTLPTGLTVNAANGTISGTPTAPAAARSYTVTVTDSLGSSATASFTLGVGVIATTVGITSSLNPSSFGQPVTFTATVSAGGATPAGNVTFSDGGALLGTAALSSGAAAFTTSTLTTGSHTITARYAGNATFGPSSSPALAQTVNIPVDSVRLRALQLNVTRMVAQSSGQAISGAIDDAISDAFGNGGVFVTPSQSGVRFNFAADQFAASEDDQGGQTKTTTAPGSGNSGGILGPDGRSGRERKSSRIDDAFAAIDQQAAKKAPPKTFHEEKDWLFWIDVRGAGVDRWAAAATPAGSLVSQSTLHGLQLNTIMGLTYKLRPNFVVGMLGGYETFNYTEQDINGKLTGDGWTVGAYMGWKILPTLLYDLSAAYSGIGYDGTAGTAQGNFNGQRWMVSTGLTGNYKTAGFFIEPSAKVYALWERENAYVDSLGTQQAEHDFGTGRASGGVKMSYPLSWADEVLLVPYLGLYGDYYFTQDDAADIAATGGVPLASTPLLQGWSARLTGGLGAKLGSGATIAVGAQYGGIGSDTRTWTATAKAQIPFW